MRYIYALLWVLLSGVPMDLNRQRRFDTSPRGYSVETLWTDEKTKKRIKKYKNRKFKKRQRFGEKHYKIKGHHAKDHRYSNQRTLRRMYRNA